MTRSPVAAVEPQGVPAVQQVHSSREAFDRSGDHEVVVVRHQAEGVDRPRPADRDAPWQRHERAAVDLVVGDPRSVGASRRGVEGAVEELSARMPRHGVGLPRIG
ncbi:MAG TPA: hypothetical protein VFL61_15915, partial [Gaiellaceae bacterium]|nr:hypothetical protein [Gaiellaceae bacterium]